MNLIDILIKSTNNKNIYFYTGARGLGVGGNPGVSRNNADIPQFPGKEKMPMNLLLHPLHFEQLFTLMQTLSDLRINGLPHPKAQILSRRVWDILMLLPTNPTVKEKLQNITEGILMDFAVSSLCIPNS